MERRTFLGILFLSPLSLYAKNDTKERIMSRMFTHRASERGVAEHGWLHSRFSFSFAEYYDPGRMGFGALRVINDDVIEAGRGFGTHPHQNMEIVSIVTKGALRHRDSAGHEGVIRAGEIQYMSAGSGIYHSEFASETEQTALFQIWIFPREEGGKPQYEQRDFNAFYHPDRWTLLVSGDGRENSIRIKQDAAIHVSEVGAGTALRLPDVAADHARLLFVIEGAVTVEAVTLGARDELQIMDDGVHGLVAQTPAKVLLFDVPV